MVTLHGGPGAGAGTWWAGLFDLDRHDVLLFDQRGCGRSTPNAADALAALEANTTQDLVADIERLRELCGHERWTVLGGSWGSTLGLAYTQAHSERVASAVLFSVVTTSAAEVEWVTRGIGSEFPEQWLRFVDVIPEAERGGNLAAAYARLLASGDEEVVDLAAARWCEWDARAHTPPGEDPADRRFADAAFRRCWARIVTHYWSNAAFMPGGALLDGVADLGSVPAFLVHGSRDPGARPLLVRELAESWPGASLRLVDAGHSGGTLVDAVRAAVELAAGVA